MAADDLGPRLGHRRTRRRHDLGQAPGLQRLAHAGQRHRDQNRLRARPHRPDIAQRVQRRDARQERQILRESAQVIGAQHLANPARDDHGGILARAAQGIAQHRRRDLGTAARAHRPGLDLVGRCPFARQRRHRHGGQRVELRHEGAVDPVLPAPEQRPGDGDAQLLGHRRLAAQRDELEIVALRMERAQRPAREHRAQVVEENGGRAHGIDPGLGARRMAEMRAIARGKERPLPLHPQIRAHPQEAVRRHRQPGPPQPAMRPRPRRAHGQARGHRGLTGKAHLLRADFRDLGPGQHPHPLRRQRAHQPRPQNRGLRRDMGGALDQAYLRPRSQPMRHRQRQFHPGDAAADHRGLTGLLACRDARGEGLPARGERAERLGGHGVPGKSRHVRHGRMDAHIDRSHVKAHLPRADSDAAGARVDPRHRTQDQPRPGEPRQAHQVDLQIRLPVMAGHHARQHPRIGRDRVGVDHRHAHPRQRPHAPHPQHQRVGMPAPDQHQVAARRDGGGHHGGVSLGFLWHGAGGRRQNGKKTGMTSTATTAKITLSGSPTTRKSRNR